MQLKIKNQGNLNSGWRYSPLEGQEEILRLIVSKLPQWVAEEKPTAIWWNIFNQEKEQEFLQEVEGLDMDYNYQKDNLTFEEQADEGTEQKSGLTPHQIMVILAGKEYNPDRLEWLADNGKHALVKFPTKLGADYVSPFVVNVNMENPADYMVVWDCSQGYHGKLGKIRKNKLIKDQLGV